MRILFLNAWSGKVREPIAAFLEERVADTDIVCLQEANDAPFFDGLFADYDKVQTEKCILPFHHFVQATYVKKTIGIRSSTVLFDDRTDLGAAIVAEVSFKTGSLLVCNFHGVAFPVDKKLDNPERLWQSSGLIEHFQHATEPILIGGDFNVLPETESIRTFERNGYHDLIKDFGITTTRNRVSWEKYPDNPQYYSDYVFVKGDIRASAFSVPQNEISDHLPMMVEIE